MIETPPRSRLRALLTPFAGESPALHGVFLAMLVLAAAALAGLVLDPRVVTGAPVWLKPLKFAVSVAVYALSFAWLMGRVTGHPRLVRAVTRVTAAALVVELLLIDLQAVRGTTSHFNNATPFDAAVFQIMGAAIFLLWICQIVAAVLILRQRFPDPVVAWSLRFGIALTAVGAAVGYLMVVPRDYQLAHGVPRFIGSHTLGAPDGSPGLPLTGWDRDHGDLRVAHFLGLHALQILPLIGWAVGRPGARLDEGQRVRLVWTGAASFLGLLVLLVWQAMRGQSVVRPDTVTAGALAVWLAATVLGAALSVGVRRGTARSAATVAS